MIKSKTICLNDKKYFKMFLGKRILKKNIYKSNGKIPVISANVFKPMGFTNKTIINNFNRDFIIWGIDGNFEFNHMERGEEFMPTDHCGCLEILDKNILPEYLLFQLEENKKRYGYDRSLRASLKSMGSFEVKIPINEVGEFDKDLQNKLIEKYRIIKEIKRELKEKKEELNSIKINLQEKIGKSKSIKIIDLLIPQSITKNITKKDLLQKGKFEVYSSQFTNDGVVGYLDSYMFYPTKEDIYITFGDHTKAIYQRTKPFSVIDNVKVLKLNKIFLKEINLKYLKLLWENLIPSLGYARHWKEAKNVEINLPLEDNIINLSAQKIISDKYLEVNEIKKNMLISLNNILDIKVNLIN